MIPDRRTITHSDERTNNEQKTRTTRKENIRAEKQKKSVA
jgi:hypothetical protein